MMIDEDYRKYKVVKDRYGKQSLCITIKYNTNVESW